MNLVIVESPSKATTIKGYLGSNYKVIASVGHVRDLPKSSLGIDIENNFEPHYINIRGKGNIISELKKEAKAANKIFLATDPDREGEAIAWHLAEQLGIPKDRPCRVPFNELTKSVVREAIKHPRIINEDLVNSQQARRILDRIVGFSLSQLLWKSVKSGLSGGRVQSVATKIIIERERQIKAFTPEEYWTLSATLHTEDLDEFTVKFFGNKSGKIKISNESEANSIINAISAGSFKVAGITHSEKQKTPPPPFKTSTLQQEAFKKLGFQTQKIMKVAQELYDGINLGSELGGTQGLITYMRTDSLRISAVARESARDFISKEYGEEYLPANEREFKDSTNSQDAHEAIRPSNVALTPALIKKALTSEQYKLYKLIWERFIASQMEVAVFDTVSISAENSGYIFKAGGEQLKSRGYLVIYDNFSDSDAEVEEENAVLSKFPEVTEKSKISSFESSKEKHFTKPPAHFTEATLIDFFEEYGIARPSTYAPIISIIISREYVKREGKYLVATELGELITDFMTKHFPEIVDYEFTASMETKLDSIENKDNTVVGVLSEFYDGFAKELEKAKDVKVSFEKSVEESDVVCEMCGSKMVFREGRFGKFLACPNYPECKNTKTVDKDGNIISKEPVAAELAGFKCETCGSEMLVKKGRYGIFYACSDYPKCKFTKQKTTDIGVSCPLCASKIVAKHGRGKTLFYSCEKYPECTFSSWDMPINEKCPDCGELLYYRKTRRSVICKNPSCDYSREEEMAVIE